MAVLFSTVMFCGYVMGVVTFLLGCLVDET